MDLNRVCLIGRVGQDPEIRYLDSGVCVAQFSLATTEKGYTAQNGQEVPERTEWHDLVAWRGLAQVVEKYVKKGDKLYVEGKLRHRTYEGTDGIKRSKTDIHVENMDLLTPKGDKKPMPVEVAPPPAAVQQQPVQQPMQQPAQAQPQAQAQPTQQSMDFSAGPDDDLPF